MVVRPHWDYPAPFPGDDTAGLGEGGSAYVHLASAVGVAWLVEVVVVVVEVVLAAVVVVALMMAEERADVQATDAGLRRALCLLKNAQREGESRILREHE